MSTPAPAAPDLDTVFDLEGGLEPSISSALVSSGIFDPDLERSNKQATTPRVEVKVRIGACITRAKIPAGAADPREALPTMWECDFEFHAVTDRNDRAQDGLHGKYRSRIRRFGATFFSVLNPELPYHRLEAMMEAGTTPNLYNQDAQTEDISAIRFKGKISVRNSAWPPGT